jgi:hypothetical protein
MDTRNVLSNVRRTPDLLTQQAGSETLIYSEQMHRAFCLNAVAAQVWQRLDGFQSVQQIAAAATLELHAPVTVETVLFTIGELRRDGLLEGEACMPPLPTASRRVLMRQLGVHAVLMLPAIAAVMCPKAAEAYLGGCVDCEVQPDEVKPDPKITPQQGHAIQDRWNAARKQQNVQETIPELFNP